MKTENSSDTDEVPSGGVWRELSEAFIGSLRLPDCQAELAEQVRVLLFNIQESLYCKCMRFQTIKNLVFVARVVSKKKGAKRHDGGRDQEEVDLPWLTRRLIRVCRLEVSKTPRNFIKVR